jgi:hypothetical protein
MAEHTPLIEQKRRRARPETSAWLILVAFFFVFCSLIAAACLAGWRYYSSAMVPVQGTLVRVHAPAGVNFQAKGSVRLDTPNALCNTAPKPSDTCKDLGEGDRVLAKPQAGYGPVASIVLPDGTRIVDMYAYPTGADLTLTRFQVSRWAKRSQELRFHQAAGYVRYDIPDKPSQPYASVSYTVEITDGVVLGLSPGGSYSVDVPRYDAIHPPAITPSGKQVIAEIAVRTGSVEVQGPQGSVIVRPDQKVQIDTAKIAGEIQQARWDLIRDGELALVAKSDKEAWYPYAHIFDPTVSDAEKNGKINVYQGCRPENPVFCTEEQATFIGQFAREGNQPKSYGVGLEQDLDIDISEYRSLRFSMWARVIQQSVAGAGIANIECPITVRFDYKQSSPTDKTENRYICVYQDKNNQPTALSGNLSGQFIYRGVPPSMWYHLSYELRDKDLLLAARYLQGISIYANGHDYISEIADISVIASQ